jgi:competence protein ComEC
MVREAFLENNSQDFARLIARRSRIDFTLAALISLILILFTACVPAIHNRLIDTKICFWDVGYGDAITIQQNNDALLIDGGYPSFAPTLLKAINEMHIHTIQFLIFTHPHPDHIGGLYGVLASNFRIGSACGNIPLSDPETPPGIARMIRNRALEYRVLKQGDSLSFGAGISLEVLNPESPVADLNDSSLVMKLETASCAALLTSDIGLQKQRELAIRYGDRLRSAVLKAPHHGGPVDELFLNYVHPQIVVISVGVNPYENPSADALKLYRSSGAEIHITQETGSVCLTMYSDGKITRN